VPTPDETLAAIDDVIDWHGSADAMVWTAEAPAPRVITPEHIRDVWVDVDITHRPRPVNVEKWAVSVAGQQIEDWTREQGFHLEPFHRVYLNATIRSQHTIPAHWPPVVD